MVTRRELLIGELKWNIEVFSEIPSLHCFGGLMDLKLNCLVQTGASSHRLFALNLLFRSLHMGLVSLANTECTKAIGKYLCVMKRYRKSRDKMLVASSTGGSRECETIELNFAEATFEFLDLVRDNCPEEDLKIAGAQARPVFKKSLSVRSIFGRFLYEVGTAFLRISHSWEGEDVQNKLINWPISCLDQAGYLHPEAHESLMTRLINLASCSE